MSYLADFLQIGVRMASKERSMPKHVGLIMDGNGRWAKAHMLPRVMGHNAGTKTLKRIALKASDMGITNLTVYAFSTENWKRSEEEVSGIFKLLVKFVNSELQELKDKNVHVNILGDRDKLPDYVCESLDKLVGETSHCDGMNFNIALNYGGRAELVRSVKAICEDVKAGRIDADDIDEELISSHLYTGEKNIPDADLIIRTSGEERLSNFLVWQASYSELMFTDTLWPDFSNEEFEDMIFSYMGRERRFGGRNEEDK